MGPASARVGSSTGFEWRLGYGPLKVAGSVVLVGAGAVGEVEQPEQACDAEGHPAPVQRGAVQRGAVQRGVVLCGARGRLELRSKGVRLQSLELAAGLDIGHGGEAVVAGCVLHSGARSSAVRVSGEGELWEPAGRVVLEDCTITRSEKQSVQVSGVFPPLRSECFGVYCAGVAKVMRCRIDFNVLNVKMRGFQGQNICTSTHGGGVRVTATGQAELVDCTVCNNAVGIEVDGGMATLRGGTVSDNLGAGVLVQNGGKVTVAKAVSKGNKGSDWRKISSEIVGVPEEQINV